MLPVFFWLRKSCNKQPDPELHDTNFAQHEPEATCLSGPKIWALMQSRDLKYVQILPEVDLDPETRWSTQPNAAVLILWVTLAMSRDEIFLGTCLIKADAVFR